MSSSISESFIGGSADSQTQSLIQALPLLVVATDADGIFVEWNHECERVTGYSAEEMIGNPEPSKLLFPEADYLAALRTFWIENSGTYSNQVWKITCKNGVQKAISWSNISR